MCTFHISFFLGWVSRLVVWLVLKRVSFYLAPAEGCKVLSISVLVLHSIWNWILGLGDINFLPLLLNSWQEGGFSWWKRSHYYGKLIPLVMYPEILGRWQISVGVFFGRDCDAPLWVQCKALVGTRQQNSQKLQGFSTLKVLTFD